MTDKVTICECFARDGLQHEEVFVPTAQKIAVIDAFSEAGFPRIEATSYSHPKHVPAFADASDVLAGMAKIPGVFYKATCPNLRAVDRAISDLAAGRGANELSFLASATEAHSQRNLSASRATQWQNIEAMAIAAGNRFRLIGVLSVAFGCPFEGAVDPGRVIDDIRHFSALGVRFITLADTIGVATPVAVKALISRIVSECPDVVPIAHFHDSRGSGIANCVAALDSGCRYFDSAMGGVGGHPAKIQYGSGLTGNVVTEDIVNLFEAMGISTGIDLDRLMAASSLCETMLGRQLLSMVARSGFGIMPSTKEVFLV